MPLFNDGLILVDLWVSVNLICLFLEGIRKESRIKIQSHECCVSAFRAAIGQLRAETWKARC